MTSANSLHPSEGHPMSTTTSSRASEAELLPCPFCAGIPIKFRVPFNVPISYRIECGECGAGRKDSLQDGEVVAAWNTRAASPVQAKRPEPAVSAEDHPDDLAVDRFAVTMKAKLKWEREERNRCGWQSMEARDLSRLLIEHLPKGDPVDVANFAMMLHQNGQRLHDHLSTPDRTEELEREVEDWRDDPSADERWNEGLGYGQEQLCAVLGVDPKGVNWDAATETLDGDVQSVISRILDMALGEDWRPARAALAKNGA